MSHTDRGRGRGRGGPVKHGGRGGSRGSRGGSRGGSAPHSHSPKPPVYDHPGPPAPQYGSRTDRSYHHNDHPKPYAAPPQPLFSNYDQPYDRPYQPPPPQYPQPQSHITVSVVSQPQPQPPPPQPPPPPPRDPYHYDRRYSPPREPYDQHNRHHEDRRYERGDRRYDRGDPGYERGEPRYDRGEPRYDRRDPGYEGGNTRYDRGDPRHDRGDPRGYDRGDPRHDRGDPRGYDRGDPRGYDRGNSRHDRGYPRYDQRDPHAGHHDSHRNRSPPPAPPPPPYSPSDHRHAPPRERHNQGTRDVPPHRHHVPAHGDLPPPYDALPPEIQRGGPPSHSGRGGYDGGSFQEPRERRYSSSSAVSVGSDVSERGAHKNRRQTSDKKGKTRKDGSAQGFSELPEKFTRQDSHQDFGKRDARKFQQGRHTSDKQGKPLKSGYSFENVHTSSSVQPSRDGSDFSSLESNQSARSESSAKFRDRGRGRGRGRGTYRGKGRGGSMAGMRGKFSSQPNLVGAVPGDDDYASDESSATVAGSGYAKNYQTDSKVPFQKKIRPRRRRKYKQKTIPGTEAPADDEDEDSGEEDAPARVTKACFQIMKSFDNPESLKQVMREHLEQSTDMAEDVTITFVEEAIICSERQGICTVLLHTDSKQLAKRIVKHTYQQLRKSLKTKVQFEISSMEEESSSKQVSSTSVNSSQSHRSQKHKRVNQILLRLDKTAAETPQKNYDEESSVGKVSEASVMASPKHRPSESSDNCVEVDDSDSEDKKTTPAPVPATLSVTVEKIFKQQQDLVMFLQTAVNDDQSPFELLPESVVTATSKTLCDLLAPSKAAAERIRKKLNSSKFENVVIKCHKTSSTAKQDSSSLKSEEIKKEIERTLRDIEKKTSRSSEVHREKILQYEKALDILESNSDEVDDEDDIDEALAVRDKLKEAVRQEEEFHVYISRIQEQIKGMDPMVTSKGQLTEMLQRVGVECQRLVAGLPMYARRHDIIDKVSSNQVSIILGETGSGKSTQMAQYIYEAGLAGEGQIVCTQPRKVAAITLAERVAKEMAGKAGDLVGYKTGVRKRISKSTKLVFCTDHSLLNECLEDPKLSNYTCIIVDEAHERSIYTDILLGMIKACLPQRPDLKVIITSATIDPSLFIKYFNTEHELRVSGRTFPVEVEYTDTDSSQEFENFEVRAVQKAVDVHLDEGVGDLLVFLTSPVEIMRCCEEFEKLMKDRSDYQCFPLHGQLPPDEQKKVFKRLPEGVRKVIFATNCAETSITIDGIKFVIDTGVAKEVRYDPKKNISLLGTHVISKSSADQRKGRAGRTSSGKCYRLYSEDGYNEMAAGTEPEIMRVHLGQAVLKLAEMGVDVKTYDFVESPSTDAIDSALNTLRELGALSAKGITETGRWISKLPFDPRQGYLVYEGSKNDLLYDAVVVAALISNGSNLFYKGLTSTEEQQSAKSKNEFGSSYGDIFTWLNVYKQWIQLPKEQQSKWCGSHSINYKVMSFTRQCVSEVAIVLDKELGMPLAYTFSEDESSENVLRKIIFDANVSSLCHYLGHLRAGYFALDAQRQVHFHPSSSLVAQNAQPEWVVYTEFTKTSRDFIRGITAVDKDWVRKAVDQGRLEVDLEEVKQRRCDVVHKEEVGPSVFRRLVGPRFSHLRVLEDELTQAGMATVVVEADRELGTLDIYSSSPINKKCINKISEAKEEVIEKLKSDEDEMGIDSTKEGECGVRVALGQGGTVKAVLMPDQSNKILIKKSSPHTTKDDIIAKFGVFGDIRECVKFKSADPWGFVRFASYLQAQEAVEKTKRDEDNVAVLKIDNRGRIGRSRFEARLSWCRKPIKGHGTAFIKCPPIERAALVGKSIFASGYLCEIQVSKSGEDLICHKTGQAQEQEIKREVMKLLDYDDDSEMNIHVTVAREKVDLSAERDRETKARIIEAFARYVPKEKFHVRWNQAKTGTVNQVVFLQFDNPVEGFEACSRLNGLLHIGGQRAEISPNLKTTIHVQKAIMDVCKTRFDAIIEGLLKWKDTEVKTRSLKLGDYAIDIMSPKPKLIVEAREIFQRELEGEVIDCGVNSLLKCLLKKQGKDMLHKIGNVMEVLIVVDDRKEKLHIYGSEKLVEEAKIRINKYLDKLEKGKQRDICFKEAGRPAGLMKSLMQKYCNLPDDFIENFGLSDVVIDFKHQRMSILGSDEAVEQAYASILDLESTLMRPGKEQKEKLMPDCIICMCPIDNSSDVYRLEGCGHSYCSDCLKMQVDVSVKDKNFPITCAEESCGMPIVWRDFRLFLQKKWVRNNKLVSMSVNAFVTANQDKYRFCLTPNCPVVYEVTTSEDGNEFSCPSCAVSLCTSCHTAYHSGLNCRMAESQKEADEQLERWRMENKDKCKKCPGCKGLVEKIAGCNKMHCTVCKTYFCWLCLEKFDGEQACYAHLQREHGGFI